MADTGAQERENEEEGDEQVLPPEPTWFDKMGDALQWKVEVPNLFNPYQIPIPDRVLVQLSTNNEARRKACNLRCLCDGYEVLNVRNIDSPLLSTSHPCISAMTRNEILDHLTSKHIQDLVAFELDKLQVQATEELARREAEERKSQPASKTQKKKAKKEAPKKDGPGFRVIRM
jgi:hypothetical protein